MDSYKKLPVNVIKYTISLVLIFTFVCLIPNNKLGLKDAFILALLATLSLAVLEHVTMILCPDTRAERYEHLAVKDDEPTNQPNATTTDVPVPTSDKPVITTETSNNTPAPTPVKDMQITEELKKHIAPQAEPPEQPHSTVVVKIPEGTGTKDVIESTGSRTDNGLINSDMPYTDYHHLPLGDYYKPTDFEYGYSFLPPEKWYPEPPFPPVCVSEKRCPVCPAYTTGTPVDVKEWMSSSRITPPDRINTDYIKEKLNAGR